MSKKYFVAVLIVLAVVVPALSQDVFQAQVNPKSANLWYFHSPAQGINFYLMTCWPNGTLLTKFGLPAFKLGKFGTVQIAVGPDLNLAVKSTKELVSSWTADVTPVISAFGITGAFVNEAGVNRDGKAIWFVRHTVGHNGVGLRWSGCGQFGKKATFFKIGPTIQLGKIQLWIAEDRINGGLTGEISFSVKL